MDDTSTVDTVDDTTDTMYEIHDCDGCGLRLMIGEQLTGRIESKEAYNQRKYHDTDCEALANRSNFRHGTTLGYKLCSVRPEGACEKCQAANAERQRPRQSARSKALRRLGQMFPSKLEEFIQEEMEAS